jgi:glutamate-1-semialdehyde aminotransferase
VLEVDDANVTYPLYMARAKGAYLWDLSGRRYIDYTMGYGPVVLGHADDRIDDAVMSQIRLGTCLSPFWSSAQVDLTEMLVDVIPGAEQATLMRTGSDATAGAVRLSRIATGRDLVVKYGYNGWHDWTAPRPAGVPAAVAGLTRHFDFNDIEGLTALMSEVGHRVACVIMMPYELEAPAPGFLPQVRELAHQHGALFVLDEMRSGFRIAVGGAQEAFGVEADLSTFSKAMANGYSISAIVGKREFLGGMAQTHMSSTFFGNAPEMVAALRTIEILRSGQTLTHITALSQQLMEGLREVVKSTGLPARVRGLPVSPFLEFDEDADAAKARFFAVCSQRGVLFHPNHQWFLSGAHTSEDVDMTLEVAASAAASACERRTTRLGTARGGPAVGLTSANPWIQV